MARPFQCHPRCCIAYELTLQYMTTHGNELELRAQLSSRSGCARPSASSIGHVAPQGGAKHLARNMACACSCCDEAVRCCGASRAGVCWRIERHGHNNGACKHHPSASDVYYAVELICGPAATLTGTATAALPPALAKAVARISLGARAWRTCCDNSCAV